MRLPLIGLTACVLLGSAPQPSAPPMQERAATPAPAIPGSPSASNADLDYVAALRAKIKGREREPAESVFTDIQILRGKPAAAVLSIMQIGYNSSLGVSCSYCHDVTDWASNAKTEKQVARRMSAMVHDINEKYLASIDGLKSDRPVVNCTTCHRGQEKPALDLQPPPVPSH